MKFLWAVGYIAALGILAHIVGQALPRRWFDPDRFPYRCAPWEQNGRVWRKLGVHRWKDHVPDMSRIMGDMVKKKLPDGNTPEGLRVLVLETCVAERPLVAGGRVAGDLFLLARRLGGGVLSRV